MGGKGYLFAGSWCVSKLELELRGGRERVCVVARTGRAGQTAGGQ